MDFLDFLRARDLAYDTPNGVYITSMSLQAMAGMKLLYRNREVLEKKLNHRRRKNFILILDHHYDTKKCSYASE